jgi:anti-sigma B factor antagonist
VPFTLVSTPEASSAERQWIGSPRSDGDWASHVVASGELDINAVPELDRALRHADAPLVVLDLRDLEFIDSSGAHLLLAADRRLRRAGRRLVVVRGNAEVEWFLALIGLDRELELVDWPPSAAPPLDPGRPAS